MAPPKGSAAYKKKDGTLTISKDQASIIWTPIAPRGAPPGVTINIAEITNLQQTPETVPKVMLKIFAKAPGEAEPVTHLFHFNSPTDPRGEANVIKDSMTNLISAAKAVDPALPKTNGSSGVSASMAMAGAAASKPAGSNAWYDDAALKADIELQQSLMRKDPTIHRTYEEARRTKPETVSNTAFNMQFWSTRTNLLRAHAVETHQQRGAYNVLSAVKPRTEDGELKLRITKEQVQLIFGQHPLVKRVYDENVPKLNEAEFWSRFFLSRLFKKLKGERIVEADSKDPVFDRYLEASENAAIPRSLQEAYIPHTIDLEGNEENQGGAKSGNRPDFTMRPSSSAKAPIIRTLNSLSEKILAQVTPSDMDADPLYGENYDELVLRDLEGNVEENRIMLNIKEQNQFFSNQKTTVSKEAALYAEQDPGEILLEMETDLDPVAMGSDSAGGLNLRELLGYNDDSDSEDEADDKVPHVASKSSLIQAQKQVWEGFGQKRSLMDGSEGKENLSGLSQGLYDRLTLTHATTTEFLHQFWSAFLSGDPDRAVELGRMVESLDRALDRITAVASDADVERNDMIKKQKAQVRDVWEKTGKKLQWTADSVGGGSKVVKQMLEATINALNIASTKYREALTAEGVDTA